MKHEGTQTAVLPWVLVIVLAGVAIIAVLIAANGGKGDDVGKPGRAVGGLEKRVSELEARAILLSNQVARCEQVINNHAKVILAFRDQVMPGLENLAKKEEEAKKPAVVTEK